MPDPIRIFLGSSNEARPTAEKLERIMRDLGKEDGEERVSIRAWWQNDVFPPAQYFLESLTKVMEETDAAVLLATPDDKTFSRGETALQPRDNVILEYGMSISQHTRDLTVLVVVGKPELPSDVGGVAQLFLDKKVGTGNFTANDRTKIKDLLERWRSMPRAAHDVKRVLPKLYESILKVIAVYQTDEDKGKGLDIVAAALLDSLAHVTGGGGITDVICDASADHLMDARAIWALDIFGPSAWLSPTAFRYLAIQTQEYLRANSRKAQEPFKFPKAIAEAIRRSSKNMEARSGRQSDTKFDDQFFGPGGFAWEEGEVELEFSRVLLWTEDELKNPITEYVSSLHESFNVPLFALLVRPDAREREFDFVAFVKRNGSIKGFYAKRTEGFQSKPFRERVPGYGPCKEHWNAIINNSNLMFALDIHHLLRSGITVDPMI